MTQSDHTPHNSQQHPPTQPVAPQSNDKKSIVLWVIIFLLAMGLVSAATYIVTQPDDGVENAQVEAMEEEVQEEAQLQEEVDATDSRPSPAASSVTPTPTPTPAPESTGPVVSLADFKGEWNGTYSSSPLGSPACNASGAVSFSVNASGSVTGYAMISSSKVPGTGTVDKNGNLKGAWNYSGSTLNYSGTLNLDTGKGGGIYQNSLGCSGSFTVKR